LGPKNFGGYKTNGPWKPSPKDLPIVLDSNLMGPKKAFCQNWECELTCPKRKGSNKLRMK